MTPRFRYFGLLLLCCCLSTLISYHLVRHLTRDMSIVSRPPAELIDEARYLRREANQLTQLVNALVHRLPQRGPVPDNTTRRWVERQFLPEVLHLKRELESTSGALEGQYERLAYAAGLARDLARAMEDPPRRATLSRQIADVVDEVNGWLSERKLGLYVREERVLPQF